MNALEKLSAKVDAIAKRLGPDPEMAREVADFDRELAAADRSTKADALATALTEREGHLGAIDVTLDMLGRQIRAEMQLRAADVTPLVGKEHREALGDAAFVNAILARLGEMGIGRDVRLTKSDPQPRVASLAAFHALAVDAIRSGSRTIPANSRNTLPMEIRS